MKEKLQALLDEMDENGIPSEGWVILRLEAILSAEATKVYSCNICGGLVQFDGTKPCVKIGSGGKQQ